MSIVWWSPCGDTEIIECYYKSGKRPNDNLDVVDETFVRVNYTSTKIKRQSNTDKNIRTHHFRELGRIYKVVGA